MARYKSKTSKLSAMEIYQLVLDGEIKCFPNGVIDKEVGKELLRYVMLEKDKLTREQICEIHYRKYLSQNKLLNVLKKFNSNISEMIKYCFSEMDIKPWELKKVANDYWKDDNNRLEALIWMAEKENVNLDSLEEVKKLSVRTCYDYFGSKIIRDSYFELLNLYYKGKYKPWQVVEKVGKWTKEMTIDAIKWLIEDVYHWNRQEVCDNISVAVFKNNGLDSMLNRMCNHSPIVALNLAYPEMNYTASELRGYNL